MSSRGGWWCAAGGVQVGGKGFDGGRESVALDNLTAGMEEWENGRFRSCFQSRISLAGTHAASKRPKNAGSFATD